MLIFISVETKIVETLLIHVLKCETPFIKDEEIVQVKCCDVVFKPLTSVDLGGQHFDAGQPMLYIDTAKTSSLEGAATTVYAQGGKGK